MQIEVEEAHYHRSEKLRTSLKVYIGFIAHEGDDFIRVELANL